MEAEYKSADIVTLNGEVYILKSLYDNLRYALRVGETGHCKDCGHRWYAYKHDHGARIGEPILMCGNWLICNPDAPTRRPDDFCSYWKRGEMGE